MKAGRILDEMPFCHALLSWGRDGYQLMIGVLRDPVKTHKPDGEVGFRAIHASDGNPMSGGMKFISSLLQPSIHQHVHILKDSMDLVDKVRQVTVQPSDVFFRSDIAHFYKSGEHGELIAQSAKRVADPVQKQVFCLLLAAILKNHLITSEG